MRTWYSNPGRVSWAGILTSVLAALALLLAPRPALAFDTGHHSDLTREALAPEGFGDTAIEAAQLQNWFTDYYSSSNPLSGYKSEADLLHFDNLFTTDALRNYWGRFKVNAKSAAQDAAKSGDTVKLLTVIGVSLHAVQDFYTHSNWVELHPRAAGGPYRTET